MFIHSFSMRKMEMYFVFLLSAMSLSVRGEIGEVSEDIKKDLLQLHINDRPVLRLSKLSNTLKNYVYESLEEDHIGAKCFELDYCTIIFKLNENVSNITAQDLFNAINNVCSENEKEEWVKVMIYTARIMDIIFIETVKNNNKKEKWYVAVYFPGGVSNLKLLIKEPLNEFDELDKYVE